MSNQTVASKTTYSRTEEAGELLATLADGRTFLIVRNTDIPSGTYGAFNVRLGGKKVDFETQKAAKAGIAKHVGA